jgi:hypothetical protein
VPVPLLMPANGERQSPSGFGIVKPRNTRRFRDPVAEATSKEAFPRIGDQVAYRDSKRLPMFSAALRSALPCLRQSGFVQRKSGAPGV